MLPRKVEVEKRINKINLLDNTIFYVTFVSNPALEETEYIQNSDENINLIESEIRDCNCIKKFKVVSLTKKDKEIYTTPISENDPEYPNKVFLEFYNNQHSYQSLFNFFYFFDRYKKFKRSIFNYENIKNPVTESQNKINSVLNIQYMKIASANQNAKIIETFLKQASKSSNKSSKKGGGGLGLIILGMILFIFTVTIHYVQTDIHLNISYFENNNLKEKRHFTYTLDTYSHLILIPLKLPKQHYEDAYKDLLTSALNKGDLFSNNFSY